MLDKEKVIGLYQSIAEENKERVFQHWHCSSISECPRTHYFHRLGVPELEKPSGAKVIRWQAGHHLETTIRQHVEKLYPFVVSNVRLTSDKLDLTGEFDNLSIFLDGSRLVEIKSVHDYAVTSKGELKDNKPYLNHEYQNHCYVLLLAEHGIEVTHIDYVYITLSGRLAVYTTEVQPDIIKAVKKRLKILNDAWESQTPPPCICSNQDHPLYNNTMRWCGYKQTNELGDIEECCSLELLKGVENAPVLQNN